jgi:hypothetical protein
MDIDLSNTDSSAATLSIAQPTGLVFSDQKNPFANNDRAMEWDFGNATFG